jgi:hypothetical protein
MFADPVVTIGGTPYTMPRTGSTENSGLFATSDTAFKFRVSHTTGKRNRHQIRLQFDTLSANPLISGQNITQSISTYLVVDVPPGYSVVAAKSLVDGFVAYLAASSGAAVGKLLGGES